MTDSLAFKPITEITVALRSGEIGAAQLLGQYADRIEKLAASSKAFISLDLERAAHRADAIDGQALSDSKLSGIPYACKDLFDVQGLATTGGSRVLADNIAQQDAEVVRRMDQAGAIFIGKNNLHEFAYGATGENEIYGTPPNPYDPARLAGGSSSGSAAAYRS